MSYREEVPLTFGAATSLVRLRSYLWMDLGLVLHVCNGCLINWYLNHSKKPYCGINDIYRCSWWILACYADVCGKTPLNFITSILSCSKWPVHNSDAISIGEEETVATVTAEKFSSPLSDHFIVCHTWLKFCQVRGRQVWWLLSFASTGIIHHQSKCYLAIIKMFGNVGKCKRVLVEVTIQNWVSTGAL